MAPGSAKAMGQVAHRFQFRVVVFIDFRGQKIQVNHCLVALRVPQAGVIFHQIKADADNQIRRVDGVSDNILAAEANGKQGVIRIHVHTALGHESVDHADARSLAELFQLRRGSAPDTSVASENNGVLRGLDARENLIHDLVVGHGAAELLHRQRHFIGVVFGDVFAEFDMHRAGFPVRRP